MFPNAMLDISNAHRDAKITTGPSTLSILEQCNLKPVTLEDAGAQKAIRWVQKEYADGREGVIEEEELAVLSRENLKQ